MNQKTATILGGIAGLFAGGILAVIFCVIVEIAYPEGLSVGDIMRKGCTHSLWFLPIIGATTGAIFLPPIINR